MKKKYNETQVTTFTLTFAYPNPKSQLGFFKTIEYVTALANEYDVSYIVENILDIKPKNPFDIPDWQVLYSIEKEGSNPIQRIWRGMQNKYQPKEWTI